MNTYECLNFCDGAQNKKDVFGWETLHEFDNTSNNKQFDARVYKQNDRIVIAFSGTEYNGLDDVRNCISSLFYSDKIPEQYKDAENLYNEVKNQYPYHVIEFAGYSLGGTLANLLSHRTGLPSMAIAPIGSKHIASKYSNYFKYDDSNITTYGRKSDLLFNKMLNKQSGKVFIVPELQIRKSFDNLEKMPKLKSLLGNTINQQSKFLFKPHLLHHYSNEALQRAKMYNNNTSFPTGLAADLFSEEEIEELKKRLEHERLPEETLNKMGEYHKRKFFERIKAETTYDGDGSDLTLANFIDKDGNFTLSPQKIDPPKPQPPIRNSNTSSSKDLSKDEKWQSFSKILRSFFGVPDNNGKPIRNISSQDILNSVDVMETISNELKGPEIIRHQSDKDRVNDAPMLQLQQDKTQTEIMQSAIKQTSEKIKTDVKTEVLDEISRQTMYPNREHVENIMRDVFDNVLIQRGYKKSN